MSSEKKKQSSNQFDEEKGLLEESKPLSCCQNLVKSLIDTNPSQLDCDAYLLASVLIEGGIKAFFLFFVLLIIMFLIFPLYMIISLCKGELKDFKFFLKLYPLVFLQVLLIVLIFFIVGSLIAPALSTILTQYLLIQELEFEVQGQTSEKYHLIKILLIAFYFIMAFKECSYATEAIGYQIVKIIKLFSLGIRFQDCISRFLTLLIYFISFSIRFCLFGLQIFLSFYLSKINLIIIYKEEDLLNLIQNYAALAAILELDNIIVLFLRLVGILNFFKCALEMFGIDFNEDSEKEEEFEKWDFGNMVGEITNSIKKHDQQKISGFIKYIISLQCVNIIIKEEKFNIEENINKFLLSLLKVFLILGGVFIIFKPIADIE